MKIRTAGAPPRALFAAFVLLSLLISLAAATVYHRRAGLQSTYELTNLVGPTVQSLLSGRGLGISIGLESGNNPIFVASRMPAVPLFVAFLTRIVGDRHVLIATFAKIIILLIPLWIAAWIAFSETPAGKTRWKVLGLLFCPFVIQPFVANVCDMQVEEGYIYSLLALGFTMVAFKRSKAPGLEHWLGLACLLIGLYFTKSSMILVVAVLTLAAIFKISDNRIRALLVVLVALAPLSWGLYQKSASGRFTFGTSLDGLNFHKGNNERFLDRYPPPLGGSLDEFDPELNAGHDFADEWSFDDYHKQAGMQFAKEHPGATLQGVARKASVFFLSLRKVGSGASAGAVRWAETAGVILSRVVIWLGLAAAIQGVVRNQGVGRLAGLTFVGIVIASALPYVVGFAYTRHYSILIYPAVLVLVLWVRSRTGATEP